MSASSGAASSILEVAKAVMGEDAVHMRGIVESPIAFESVRSVGSVALVARGEERGGTCPTGRVVVWRAGKKLEPLVNRVAVLAALPAAGGRWRADSEHFFVWSDGARAGPFKTMADAAAEAHRLRKQRGKVSAPRLFMLRTDTPGLSIEQDESISGEDDSETGGDSDDSEADSGSEDGSDSSSDSESEEEEPVPQQGQKWNAETIRLLVVLLVQDKDAFCLPRQESMYSAVADKLSKRAGMSFTPVAVRQQVNRLRLQLGLPNTTTATGLLYAVTNAGTRSAGPSSPSQAVMDALAAASPAERLAAISTFFSALEASDTSSQQERELASCFAQLGQGFALAEQLKKDVGATTDKNPLYLFLLALCRQKLSGIFAVLFIENCQFLVESSPPTYSSLSKKFWQSVKNVCGGKAIRLIGGQRGASIGEHDRRKSMRNTNLCIPSESSLKRLNGRKAVKAGIDLDAVQMVAERFPTEAAMAIKYDARIVHDGVCTLPDGTEVGDVDFGQVPVEVENKALLTDIDSALKELDAGSSPADELVARVIGGLLVHKETLEKKIEKKEIAKGEDEQARQLRVLAALELQKEKVDKVITKAREYAHDNVLWKSPGLDLDRLREHTETACADVAASYAK